MELPLSLLLCSSVIIELFPEALRNYRTSLAECPGDGCDLFVTFQTKNVLLDLNDYVKDDPEFNPKAFYPEIVNRFTVGGKLYAIPRDTAPFACVYYNKKLFDASGVPYPKDGWDMNDMLDKARKLTKVDREGRVLQYGFYAWAWQNFVYAFGGSLADNVKNPTRCTLDRKESLDGLQFYSDLINKYKVQPSSITMTNLAMGVQGMFSNDRLAMFASGLGNSMPKTCIKASVTMISEAADMTIAMDGTPVLKTAKAMIPINMNKIDISDFRGIFRCLTDNLRAV